MFTYTGTNKKLTNAVKAANSSDLLAYLEIEIYRQGDYDMSTVDGDKLSQTFAFYAKNVNTFINIYYPVWRFSKAYGYFSASDPNNIFINGYRLDGIHPVQLVGLLHHEGGHSMDCWDLVYSYHHGNNSSKGKELTYQYSLNRFVNAFYGYKKPKRLSICQRIMRWF